MKDKKIVLAYSGGLDTSVAIKWLQEKYQYQVIALAADLGEGKDLSVIHDRAMQAGAAACHIIDAKAEFANSFLSKAIKSNALYEGVYPLISALSRPLISKMLVDVAKQEKAVAVAHGCTGKGNDQVRFDVSINTLDPELQVVAPVRESPMSREEAIAYAEANGISLPIKQANPFSIDLNLWGRSCECGVLEDPWAEPPEAAYALTASIANTPDQAEYLELEFKQGLPVKLNGETLPLHTLVEKLNLVAGKHGVGRIDHVENRLVGIKSREIYEAPAATTIIAAHKALESICLMRDVVDAKAGIEQQIANNIYNGYWYSPLFTALNAFIDETQKQVSGLVKIKLHKGHAAVVGRKSDQSLYQFDLATYNADDTFDHAAALGFIKLWGLPLQVQAKVQGGETS